ncbi:MAG: hypothetical protein DME10_26285 [Candidatus Rokuibacteriota bacterium]|nr:MAG: hypothetical protein DME10_26285 [Candidatus Rokubacteria bacterium]
MSTVLVTGGAGFMGSHLVERLLEEGIAVRILDNLSTGSLGNLQGVVERFHGQGEGSGGVKPGGQLEVVIGDVRDRELVRTATRNVQAVFHLAAIPSTLLGLMSPAELETVNVQGTLNVLQAAVTEGVRRLVFASSASVYGTPESLPVSETCPLKPESLYPPLLLRVRAAPGDRHGRCPDPRADRDGPAEAHCLLARRHERGRSHLRRRCRGGDAGRRRRAERRWSDHQYRLRAHVVRARDPAHPV